MKVDVESAEFGHRFELLLEALVSTCGSNLRTEFATQVCCVCVCVCKTISLLNVFMVFKFSSLISLFFNSLSYQTQLVASLTEISQQVRQANPSERKVNKAVFCLFFFGLFV